MENDLKGIENYLALTGGSSYRGFELWGSQLCLGFLISYSSVTTYVHLSLFFLLTSASFHPE